MNFVIIITKIVIIITTTIIIIIVIIIIIIDTLSHMYMYDATIVISAQVFYAVAEALNDFENHRTNTDHINRLILKVHIMSYYIILYHIKTCTIPYIYTDAYIYIYIYI